MHHLELFRFNTQYHDLLKIYTPASWSSILLPKTNAVNKEQKSFTFVGSHQNARKWLLAWESEISLRFGPERSFSSLHKYKLPHPHFFKIFCGDKEHSHWINAYLPPTKYVLSQNNCSPRIRLIWIQNLLDQFSNLIMVIMKIVRIVRTRYVKFSSTSPF